MTHPRAHPHAIHCLHTRGWHTRSWCLSCRRHWEDTCGELYSTAYERIADANLVHAILIEMEDGTLPIPPEILSLDLTDLGIETQRPAATSNN